MKYKILMIIISMVLVLISCDSNRENINNSELNNEISTDADEEQNELIEESKMEYVVKPVEKNTEGKKTEEDNETRPDDSLESDLVITKDEIDQYFNFNYDYLKEKNGDEFYCGMSTLLGYTLEFPFISIDGVRLYYANNTDNLLPSYIRLSTEYEIEALRDYGFEKGMSLNDLVRMDSSLKIEDYWIGYQEYYDSFTEIKLDDYVYFLDASDPEGVIWDVYIRREGSNLIDEGYKDILNMVSEHSNYKGYPLFLTAGNINNDSYEDIIITFEKEYDENSDDFFEENRISMILFGSEEGYIKYGEVLGLITSYTGAFGPPIVSTSIEDGIISISQYGGSAWRWNITSKYKYNEIDEKIYLFTEESSHYHNVRPVEDTLNTVVTNFEEGIDILDGSTFQNNDIQESVSEIVGKSTIVCQKLNSSDDIKDKYVNELVEKHIDKMKEKIRKMDVEGEFEITPYYQVKNEKFTSLCIYANGYYYDYSKEIEDDEYNGYFYDKLYVNIDLVNLKEMNLFDYYTIDEVAQALYDIHMEWGNDDSYSIRTKEDIIKVIENSINNIDDNNKFAYSFNDLSISLILSLQYNNEDIMHERECALLRKDELVVESEFYKIY